MYALRMHFFSVLVILNFGAAIFIYASIQSAIYKA